jgi:DNA topoisomerase-1
LKELGEDPQTTKDISVKDGRYGPYVTDGETNASLPRGENPEDMTLERATEMLAEKRAKGPVKRKQTKKTTARRRSTKKKTTTKTTKKKTT